MSTVLITGAGRGIGLATARAFLAAGWKVLALDKDFSNFELKGAVPPDKVQRAIDLSRQTYCSVWHSLRPDIELVVTAA